MGKQVCVVANSHIDPVWLWDKFEGIDEVVNTFRSACDRLDEYPELRFTASSTCFYRWVEDLAPEVFARVKAHVASGRWEVAGAWWVENDVNLPLADSFRASVRLSRPYLQERLGVEPDVAFSPDTFGHPAVLPSLLRESGFGYYLFCRPSAQEKPNLPRDLFWWEHEAARVLCYRLKHHYTQQADFGAERFEQAVDEAGDLSCFFFGMGDHGGGPTIQETEAVRSVMARRKDVDIRFTTLREFFALAERTEGLPVVAGDLHMHAVGCYSVNRGLKEGVRQAERTLAFAERAMSMAGTSPGGLDTLWERVLLNEFHDILPGSCSPDAARQARDELGGVRGRAEEAAYGALKALSRRTPVGCREGEFRIVNTLPYPVTGPFEIESFLYFRAGARFQAADGREVPLQVITPSVTCANHRWLFVDTIPGQSMARYRFDVDAPSGRDDSDPRFASGERIALGGRAVTAPGIAPGFWKGAIRLGVVQDSSDTWSHGVRGYGEAANAFQATESSVCEGPLASYLLVRQAYRNSTADLLFTVYRDLPFVDLRVDVSWQERQAILKLEIPAPEPFDAFLAQGAGFAIEKRTDGAEEPLHGWLLAGGLALLQDGAFAFDRTGDRLRVTLVRSSYYGFHDPWELDRKGPLNPTDLGLHTFRFRFMKGCGLGAPEMDRALAAFVEPFKVVRENG